MGIVNEFLTGTATRYQIETYGKREILDDLEQDMRAGVYIYLKSKDNLKAVQNAIPDSGAAARIKKFLGYHVGKHEVIITNTTVEIGCKTFSREFIRKLVECTISWDENKVYGVNISTKSMKLIYEAIMEGIIASEDNFYTHGYTISRKEVREWLEADLTE